MKYGSLISWNALGSKSRLYSCSWKVALCMAVVGVNADCLSDPPSTSPVLAGHVLAHQSGPKIVYCHYMHAYAAGYMWDKASNYRSTALRTNSEDKVGWPENEFVERTWWSARMAAFAHSGDAGMAEDFKLAHRAGLDAFALLINEKHLPQSAFSAAINAVAKMAETDSIKVIPDMWGAPATPEGWTQYGTTIKAFMDQHPGAFLTYQGKFVISITVPYAGPAMQWQNFSRFFDAMGGTSKYYIIADTTTGTAAINSDFARHVNAYTYWTATWGWGDKDPFGVTGVARSNGIAQVASVHPAYFGGRKGAESGAECLGSCTFTDQWKNAILNGSPFTEVQTWNDFSEDHCITETNYRGDALIDLNNYWVQYYKQGFPPQIPKDKLFLFHHRQKVNPELSEATIHTQNGDWHHTPFVDCVSVVSMLTRPGEVAARVGRTVWRIQAPAGYHEWLIYVPDPVNSKNAAKMAYTRSDSYPVSTAERTVTVVREMPYGEVEAVVARGGREEVKLNSKYNIDGKAKWQDLSLVADESF